MRLSEAIRLGAMLRPQVFGRLSAEITYRGPGDVLGLHPALPAGTCALGAAFEAAQCKTRETTATASSSQPFRGSAVAVNGAVVREIEFPDDWTALYLEASCPECGWVFDRVFRLIPHLNDDHKWTREQIADWCETVEGPRNAEASVIHVSIQAQE